MRREDIDPQLSAALLSLPRKPITRDYKPEEGKRSRNTIARLDLATLGLTRNQISRLSKLEALTTAVDLVYWANRAHVRGIEPKDIMAILSALERDRPWIEGLGTIENFQRQQDYLWESLSRIHAPQLDRKFGTSVNFINFLKAVALVLGWNNALGWVKSR